MIKDNFWTDSYIANLDPVEKLLFLYLLTNPLCNIAGIYEIQPKRIAFDTGIDAEMVEKLLKRLVKDNKILRTGDWILIINHGKHQTFKNENVIKGISRIIEDLPSNVKALKGFERLSHFTLLNLTLPSVPTSFHSVGTLTVDNPMYTYSAVDEDGNPKRTKRTKPKEVSERNKEYIKIGFLFEKMVEKAIGEKPPLDKAFFILKNAKEKLGVDDFEALFKYFLNDPKLTPEQKISLPFCCSQQYIAKWKVSRKNKTVSQIEASSEIIL